MKAIRRVATFTAATMIAAVSFGGATTALASAASGPQAHPQDVYIDTETGSGATLQGAELVAKALIRSAYTGCTITLLGDSETDGVWYATMQGVCTGLNLN
jgi:hypothetical protein